MKNKLFSFCLALVLFAFVGAAFVFSGSYNVGADEPHWAITSRVLQYARERSIAKHSQTISVPPLADRQLVSKGAGQYEAMCVQCHLAPGIKDSEIRPGLYPLPPNLALQHVDPASAFWVIKHGLKMSGMPAWGNGHDDATIWSIVAFLQAMPAMTPEQYKQTVAADVSEEMHMPGHEQNHQHAAPSMAKPLAGNHH